MRVVFLERREHIEDFQRRQWTSDWILHSINVKDFRTGSKNGLKSSQKNQNESLLCLIHQASTCRFDKLLKKTYSTLMGRQYAQIFKEK